MKYAKFINSLLQKLDGKTIVITGASSGLGLEIVKALATSNTTVVIGVRNLDKMQNELNLPSKEKVTCTYHVLKLDLTDISSIENFAMEVSKISENGIDAVINNAGVFARKKEVLANGHELHFFTNCVAPILLSKALVPLLSKKPNSKIVYVSSVSIGSVKVSVSDIEKVEVKDDIKTYANSKRWLTYYALELKRELASQNIDVEIVHPGISGTSLLHYSHSKLGKFGYSFVKAGMKLLFPSPKKACLSELAALTTKSEIGEWTCPSGLMSVYGYPKLKKIKLKLEAPDIQIACYTALNEIINNLHS